MRVPTEKLRSTQVSKSHIRGSNELLVQSGISKLGKAVGKVLRIGIYGRSERSTIHHLKGFQKLLDITLLGDEVPLGGLSHLKTKEEV